MRTFIDKNFRGNVQVTYVVGEQTKDDWSAYKASFLVLSDKLTKQISARSFDLVKELSASKTKSETKEVLEQLETFEKVLEKCK
jgi:hypothetical protein